MKIFKKLLTYCFYLVGCILLFVVSSVLLSYITVHKKQPPVTEKKIFLHSNGVHLSIIIPIKDLTESVKKGLKISKRQKYARFGWGSEDFYLNVPTWSDFKMKYALGALFLNKPTLIEVSYHKSPKHNWVPIACTQAQLQKVNTYVLNSFQLDKELDKKAISQNLYPNSYFYQANGSYSPVKTCNTWVNNGFKESGLKASYWTLFDFGLLNKYKND